MARLGSKTLGALLLATTGLCAPGALAQSLDIPVSLVSIGTGTGQYYRYVINVGVAGGAPHPYLLDTGSALFNVPQAFVPTTLSTKSVGASYIYGDGNGYYGNLSTVSNISFYAAGATTPTVTLPTSSAGYVINEVTAHLLCYNPGTCASQPKGTATINVTDPAFPKSSTTYYVDPRYPSGTGGAPPASTFYVTPNPAGTGATTPPIETAIYGTFGAGDFATIVGNGTAPGTSTNPPTSAQVTVGSILGQSTTSGYVVAGNATQTAQSLVSCNPCVNLGLTAALRAQFGTVVPWIAGSNGPSYPVSGANSSTEFGVNFTYTLNGNGQSPLSYSGPTLLDSGTQYLNLHTGANVSAFEQQYAGYPDPGTTVTMTGSVSNPQPAVFVSSDGSTGLTYQTEVYNTSNAAVPPANGENNTPGITFFLQDSVMYDLQNQAVGYTSSFVTDAAITSALNVTAAAGPLGLAGVISGTGLLTIAGGGVATLSGGNIYTGATVIAPGGQLFMAGPGSIAASSGVQANGLFDISRSSGGVSIADLSGGGQVNLGSQTLTVTNAASTFSGVIADGGAAGGVLGSLTIAGGTATLAGVNTYTGATTVNPGATLALSGNGSIAASAGLADNGVFDISATKGAMVQLLAGSGVVRLGGQVLTLSNAIGGFTGVLSDGGAAGGTGGGLTIAKGTQILAAASTYTGATAIAPGATLAIYGFGGVANSAVSNAGTLDISSSVGTSIGGLSGTGLVSLGTQLLTISKSGGAFSGVLADGGLGSGTGGALTVAGGTQTLSGVNTYTGATTINAGATLALAGAGGIGASSRVANAGILDISATSGTSVTALTGSGQVALGSRALTITIAAGAFAGALTDGGLAGGTGGSLVIAGGAQTLAGVNSFTGAVTIASGASLALTGGGSIAASSNIVNNGRFDISATKGTSAGILSGGGTVSLGGQTLTVAPSLQVLLKGNPSGQGTPGVGTFSGVLSDGGVAGGTGGSLAVGSQGTLTLTGRNIFTGATSIAPLATLALAGSGSIASSSGVAITQGVLDVSSTSAGASIANLSGSGRVSLGGQTLTLASGSGSFGGVIGDGGIGGGIGGKLVVSGGTQTLAGLNTFTGGTTITGGGTLAIAADAALGAATGGLTINNGTLLAQSSIATTRAVTIGGGGGTINGGLGQVNLNGSLSIGGAFVTVGQVQLNGGTASNSQVTVSSGQLSENGAFSASGLVIASGARLRGTGTISAPTTVFGTLAPGNSPGTLTFNAPVTLTSGAVSQFDIDGTGTGTGAGNYSRVVVNSPYTYTAAGLFTPQLRGIAGSATNSYTPALGQSFNVVAAGGGVVGSFAGLVQPAGLATGTRFDALYGATTVNLVVTPSSYGNLGLAGLSQTVNEAAVGAALDAQRPAAGVAMTTGQSSLYGALYLVAGTSLAGALDQLAPTVYADRMLAERNSFYLLGGAVGDEMEARRNGGQPRGDAQTAPSLRGGTVWMTGLGQFETLNSRGAPGATGSTAGMAAGVDAPLLPWLTTGVALGYTSPNVSDRTGAHFNGDTLQFQAYASLHEGIAFLDAQLGGGFYEGTAYRPQSFAGSTASGQTNGRFGGGSLKAGLHLDVSGWLIESSVSFAGLGLGQDRATELLGTGTGQTIGTAGLTSVQSVFGVRVERSFPVATSMAVVPSLRAGWLHEFGDLNATVSTALPGGAPFIIQSAPIGRDSAVVGAGVALRTRGALAVFADYTGTLNGHSRVQNVTGGIRYAW